MPFQKGHAKIGGKKAGTKNWITRTVAEICEKYNCNPFEGMALIANGKIPCGACHGAGKTRVKAADGSFFDRTCESCYGSKLEKVSPETRLNAYSRLGKYIKPELSAVQISNPDGSLRPAWEVVILEAKDGKESSR